MRVQRMLTNTYIGFQFTASDVRPFDALALSVSLCICLFSIIGYDARSASAGAYLIEKSNQLMRGWK